MAFLRVHTPCIYNLSKMCFDVCQIGTIFEELLPTSSLITVPCVCISSVPSLSSFTRFRHFGMGKSMGRLSMGRGLKVNLVEMGPTS